VVGIRCLRRVTCLWGDAQDSGNTGSYYEAFGEAARCFEVTWKGDESPGCLRHRCSEGLLYLKLGAEYVACPVDGGMVRRLPASQLTEQCGTPKPDGVSAV
jgi:hypothetical protein